MFFSPETDSKDELLRVMLDWAFGGFEPLGPDDFNLNQNAIVCNKHWRMLFEFSAIFKCVSCSIVCCIHLLYILFFLRQDLYASISEWEHGKPQSPYRKVI